MRLIRAIFFITIVSLTGSVLSNAQSSSDSEPMSYSVLAKYPVSKLLGLSGTFYRPCYSLERTQEGTACYKFKMALHANFSHIIVINPGLSYGTGLRRAIFYFPSHTIDPETGLRHYAEIESGVDIKPSSAEIESFKLMVPLMDTPLPPQNMTLTLDEGESSSFEQTLEVELPVDYVDGGYRQEYDKVTGKFLKRALPKEILRPSGVRLIYEFSFSQYVSDPDFLEHLNQRWAPYGYIPVDADGVYRLSTGKIAIR
jgi:hypothetical protein